MPTDIATHAVDTMSREELIAAFRELNAENAKLRERVASLELESAELARIRSTLGRVFN